MEILPARIIGKKRGGQTLSRGELEALFRGYLDGSVADYQMAAFLMAIHFQGMDGAELDSLMALMIESGAVLRHENLPGPTVDKHSTGGVGDKTSLVLAPLVAACGGYVPMISGRGLGHTTGTLDKLESISGFRTDLSTQELGEILAEVGVVMTGQTEEVAPLDRRLYALRDATATVPSVPLIAASIMSKKLAEGIDGLVLDVKTGPGAFLPAEEEGRELARTMVDLGKGRGVRTVALLTAMDAPLGRAVGNGLETREALECLHGQGPEDLTELSLALAGEMLCVGGLAPSPQEGILVARRALEEGRGLAIMTRLVAAQGGDPRVVEDPARIPEAPLTGTVEAGAAGFVTGIDPLALGYGVVELGGGRRRIGDRLDRTVGFRLQVKVGDQVEPGAPLGEVHAATPGGLATGLRTLREAIQIGEEELEPPLPLIRERVA